MNHLIWIEGSTMIFDFSRVFSLHCFYPKSKYLESWFFLSKYSNTVDSVYFILDVVGFIYFSWMYFPTSTLVFSTVTLRSFSFANEFTFWTIIGIFALHCFIVLILSGEDSVGTLNLLFTRKKQIFVSEFEFLFWKIIIFEWTILGL